ncbi:hypothetical protein HHI36_010242 [Cryptolaemus montrouzieri]|uniref:Uncharacterized protein n=1 Tax=Cryptolaemus montrouzieri TaxID=559131 RepID=A0ABD2MI95_9CUCU
MDRGISGFRTALTWPFEPNKFSENEFGPNEPSDSTAIEIPLNLNETAVNVETPVNLIPGSSETNQGLNVPIKTLVPVSILKTNQTNKSRAKQDSEILTTTPLKSVLEKKQEKRNLKKEAKEIKRENNEKKRLKEWKNLLYQKKTRETKKPGVRKLQFDDSESESCDESQLWDDDELGRDKEIWYRCVICSFWLHAVCSGWE